MAWEADAKAEVVVEAGSVLNTYMVQTWLRWVVEMRTVRCGSARSASVQSSALWQSEPYISRARLVTELGLHYGQIRVRTGVRVRVRVRVRARARTSVRVSVRVRVRLRVVVEGPGSGFGFGLTLGSGSGPVLRSVSGPVLKGQDQGQC